MKQGRLDNYKKSLENNGKPTAREYREYFEVPNFTEKETCFLEPTNWKDKFLVFLWFIVLITGYLDILEPFIIDEVGEVDVTITKLVSNTKKYSCSYKLDNIIEDDYTPNKNEIYTPKGLSENKDTKTIELMN